jgi:predicted hotdog family 3-hydroxylacyl-ACP dehydratase
MCGLNPQARAVLGRMGAMTLANVEDVKSYDDAVVRARDLIERSGAA